jgi:anaerobic magnesium-protoporphyrin IX monomethyl ester cyclase
MGHRRLPLVGSSSIEADAAAGPRATRVLLIDANNQRRWIGGRVKPELHIPPVGLLYVAAMARTRFPELQIRVVESSLHAPTDEALRALLDEFQPEVLGIRGISLFAAEVAETARVAKSWGVPVVIGGGPLATLRRGEMLTDMPELDMLIVGEGEIAFAKYLAGADVTKTRGFVTRSADGPLDTGDGETVDNLDDLPFPDYSLIDLDLYRQQLSYAYNHRRQGVIVSSRGCPYRCTYCNTFAGKDARMRSAENVYAEMRQLWLEHEVSDFYVVDDIFNLKRDRTEKIFRLIIENGHKWRLYFVNGLRADIMTRELVDLMVEAGAAWVTYAVESGSPRIQKLIKKNLRVERAADIIRYTQSKGIVVNINTMFGFPTETAEEAAMTLDFLGGLEEPSILPYHFALRLYEDCEIVDQAGAAGWDVEAMLAGANLAYNHLPEGTPSFPRADMIEHMIQFHSRFGMERNSQLRRSINRLQGVGYTDRDIADMYSVLLDVDIPDVAHIFERGQIHD